MARTYRNLFEDSISNTENILDDIEGELNDIDTIVKSISYDEVSDEINSKLGTIEETVDRLLHELR